MTTLYIILSFGGGLAFYRFVLDQPEVINKIGKIKPKGQNNTHNIDVNFDSQKALGTISADMSRREVIRVWKQLKNL